MSPSRIVTPRLEAAITMAMHWLDEYAEDMRRHGDEMHVHGSDRTGLDEARSELLEAWDEARSAQMNAG
jgi:hypothetical protein